VASDSGISKAAGLQGKHAERMQERHHARIAEAESRCALTVVDRGALETVERLLTESAVVTEAFDFEKLAVNGLANFTEVNEVFDAFGGIKVARVVDGGFGA
jgi:hypothetical protein